MFKSIVAGLKDITNAILAQNKLIDAQNELLKEANTQLTRIADEMAPPKVVGLETEHSAPEPRS